MKKRKIFIFFKKSQFETLRDGKYRSKNLFANCRKVVLFCSAFFHSKFEKIFFIFLFSFFRKFSCFSTRGLSWEIFRKYYLDSLPTFFCLFFFRKLKKIWSSLTIETFLNVFEKEEMIFLFIPFPIQKNEKEISIKKSWAFSSWALKYFWWDFSYV